MKIILASASPRRKELLEQIGVKFMIEPAKGEEKITKNLPGEVVKELALQKAREVAKDEEEPVLVIGADTVVAYGDEILGKPKDEKDAYRMLSMLQGKAHAVYTGVALIVQNPLERKEIVFAEKTKVFVYPMTKDEILSYIATKEPMDKAGSYGIQGKFAAFIEKIEGDYNNVVGLPIAGIYQKLLELGIDILEVS
ncbi:MAG: Maf family protein [Lachnospiraceae bacterium]|nr:Maf family protein [Lachnospiraceae bacterium]MDD6170642.1 Maf family protein [Lachnospiraceae bacterium]MDY4839057.1 Maf family protein [Lachnospiraceae bacterium]